MGTQWAFLSLGLRGGPAGLGMRRPWTGPPESLRVCPRETGALTPGFCLTFVFGRREPHESHEQAPCSESNYSLACI